MRNIRSSRAVALWLLILLSPLGAQGLAAQGLRDTGALGTGDQDAAAGLALYAYTLRHQPARDALEVLQNMLSPEGKVSLKPGTRTLEIRDRPEILEQVGAFLRSFDHPPRTLDFEVMVVRATTVPISPQPPSSPELPRQLIQRWRKLLRFQHYELLARARLEPMETERVTYEMDGYHVSFRMGTLLANRRIKLHDFRLSQGQGRERKQLIHSTLNPWLGQPTTLGIAHDEESASALMLVVICRSPESW